jgi:hypothetical protein
MISHLIPYEKTYIGITIDADEAFSILQALKEIKPEANSIVGKFQQMLENDLARAIQHQNKKDAK